MIFLDEKCNQISCIYFAHSKVHDLKRSPIHFYHQFHLIITVYIAKLHLFDALQQALVSWIFYAFLGKASENEFWII